MMRMMRPMSFHVSGVWILLALLSASCAGGGKGEAGPPSVSPERGAQKGPGVTLTDAQLSGAGLSIQVLAATRRQAAPQFPGRVLSVQDLAQARQSIAKAAADEASAQSQWEAAEAESHRLDSLNRSGANVSKKAAEAARASAQQAKAQTEAAQAVLLAGRAQLQQTWGPVLAEAIENGPPLLSDLLSLKKVLVLVTPGEAIGAQPPREALVIASGRACPARFLSAAPRTDGVLQGTSWLYSAQAGPSELPAGLSVEVRLPQGSEREGVQIPRQAVVWWQGAPWVYVEEGAGRFRRVALASPQETEEGWFATGEPKAGEKLVAAGAQALLSEELKGMGVTGEAE